MKSNHHTGVERKKTTLDRQKKQRHTSVIDSLKRFICCNLLRAVAICNANKTCGFHRLAESEGLRLQTATVFSEAPARRLSISKMISCFRFVMRYGTRFAPTLIIR